jgi:hypothetical protein
MAMAKWRLMLIVLALALVACNLSTQPLATAPAVTETIPATFALPATVTPLALPGQPTLQPPPLPLPNSTALPSGTLCQVYTTFSGNDPDNLLSLRAQPGTTATQLYKLPNNSRVFRVPDSQEVEAEGYHWLNIIYVDAAQNRYEGWTARDSFSTNGVRDPSIETLRPTGQQSPC